MAQIKGKQEQHCWVEMLFFWAIFIWLAIPLVSIAQQYDKKDTHQEEVILNSTVQISALTPSTYITTYITVCDSSGKLGLVNLYTGEATIIGSMGVVMTDIAFSKDQLFGISFTNLYKIDLKTASVQLIGPHHIPDGNALVFSADGKLYGAGASTTSLYLIDKNTGNSTNIGNIGYYSSGDLVFNNNTLFMTSTTGRLIKVELKNGIKVIDVGSIRFQDVYGLATINSNITYGLSGTRLLSIDVNTGVGKLVLN